MKINTVTDMGSKLGVTLCGDDAVLVQGKQLCVAKSDSGILIVDGDLSQAIETFESLGYKNFQLMTCKN